MRKQYLYIIACLLLLFTTEAYSQHVDGSVRIRSLQLEKADSELFLSFDVLVNREAMNYRQDWSITPELISLDQADSVRFPRLLINGRQKERHYKRKKSFKNVELLNNLPRAKTHIIKHTDTTMTYSCRIPFESWMVNSVLQINQLLTSSRNKKQLFVLEDCKRLRPVPVPLPTHPVVAAEPEITFEERIIQASAKIEYPVNVSEILPGYRNNPQELQNIQNEFEKIKSIPESEIIAVYLKGHASPEGEYALNEKLARRRVEGLKEYLITRFMIPANRIHVSYIPEDWEGLRTVIENKNIPGKKEILSIIDSGGTPEEKERKLRRHPQWSVLVKEVFPDLRRTEYQIQVFIKILK